MNPLDIPLSDVGNGAFEGVVPEGWAQGRTTFGGYGAALVVRSVRRQTDARVRAVTVDFVRALQPSNFLVSATPVRIGRSVGRWQVTVTQNAEIAITAWVTTAEDRRSAIPPRFAPLLNAPQPETLQSFSLADFGGPEFARNFDWRWIEGVPFSGGDSDRVRGWIAVPGLTVYGAEEIVAIADSYPPPTLIAATERFPASTITSFTTMHLDRVETDWLHWDGTVDWVGGGLAEYSAYIHSRDGRLVASMRQFWIEFSDRNAGGVG